MIGTGRRINDFDNFMTHNTTSPRTTPLNNIHNYNSHPERHMYAHNTLSSPNRISNSRKPMISPARPARPQTHKRKLQDTDRTTEKFCSNENHPHKKAEYFIHIEDEDMYYCGVCATQAASQGFAVNRLQSKKSKTIPNYPQYAGHKRYIQLTDLLKGIINLQTQYKKLQPKKAAAHYEQQQQLLNCFYDELQAIVQKMRKDHLNDLRLECDKKSQNETVGLDHLKIHVEELREVWDDIEANMPAVIKEVDQDNYNKCLKEHFNSLQMFNHKLEQYREEQQQYTNYTQPQLELKVKLFEEQLIDIWNEDREEEQNRRIDRNVIDNKRQPTPSDRSTTIKNVHEMLPKPVAHQNGQGQGAFRNLFPEEEGEERLPEASPQFKAF